MIKDITASIAAIVVCTVVLGLGLPALFTGLSQVAFSHQANGSLVRVHGADVGSRLVAQPFTGKRYFHERPSATAPAYNGAGTTFANLGPSSADLAKAVRTNAEAVLRLEAPYNPGLTIGRVPVDAVTTSASGVDPEVSPAYAELQARRIAAVRGLSLAAVEKLIHEHTDGRWLGLFGEPAVNVLELNVALDRTSGS